MGLMDSVIGLSKGNGRGAQPVPLLPGEVEIMRSPAGLRPGALNSRGGDLVMTNVRVVFTPLDVRDLGVVLKWGLGKAGAGQVANPLIGYGVKAVGDPVNVGGGLQGIAAVGVGSPATIRKPPTPGPGCKTRPLPSPSTPAPQGSCPLKSRGRLEYRRDIRSSELVRDQRLRLAVGSGGHTEVTRVPQLVGRRSCRFWGVTSRRKPRD